MKIKSYKNRCEVPQNDIELVNKDDVVNALKGLKNHWEEMYQESKKENSGAIGFANCSEQIEHLIQDITDDEG